MKKMLLAMLSGLLIALPFAATAAPDETQKQLIQRAQEAKKKLNAAQASSGAERQKMMQEHMKMMQNVMAQMQKAKPQESMSPQMGECMEEHMKLMNEMMGMKTSEHRMMMEGMGMQGKRHGHEGRG